MTVEETIKQAYAYGASQALQGAGTAQAEADQIAVKLAEDVNGMHPALGALLQTAPAVPVINKTAGALSKALLGQ